MTAAACVVGAAVSAAGATGGRPAWPAPADAMHRTVAAKLTPERKESFLHHVHAHLDVFVNGRRIRVPAGIGIDIRNPGVQTFPTRDGTKAYGGISLCSKPCISPLHTHDDTGILHTESASPLPNTLGQFFTEWGVRLTRTCVGTYCRLPSPHVYVNGKAFRGAPATIQLTDHKEIAIVIGTPPATIPVTADFSQA
jgi:hypothetical protein